MLFFSSFDALKSFCPMMGVSLWVFSLVTGPLTGTFAAHVWQTEWNNAVATSLVLEPLSVLHLALLSSAIELPTRFLFFTVATKTQNSSAVSFHDHSFPSTIFRSLFLWKALRQSASDVDHPWCSKFSTSCGKNRCSNWQDARKTQAACTDANTQLKFRQ